MTGSDGIAAVLRAGGRGAGGARGVRDAAGLGAAAGGDAGQDRPEPDRRGAAGRGASRSRRGLRARCRPGAAGVGDRGARRSAGSTERSRGDHGSDRDRRGNRGLRPRCNDGCSAEFPTTTQPPRSPVTSARPERSASTIFPHKCGMAPTGVTTGRSDPGNMPIFEANDLDRDGPAWPGSGLREGEKRVGGLLRWPSPNRDADRP